MLGTVTTEVEAGALLAVLQLPQVTLHLGLDRSDPSPAAWRVTVRDAKASRVWHCTFAELIQVALAAPGFLPSNHPRLTVLTPLVRTNDGK